MNSTNIQYEAVIGLEIHIQLVTKSKMFCRCDNDSETAAPNTNVCPVCMGYPGTLPVANKTAIEWGTKTAIALGCRINPLQRFDRKNYFYPDLPKGYQISQFFYPVGEQGSVTVDYLGADRKTKEEFTVGITRLHLEEDAGKLTHEGEYSYVDYNRCGTPLMEIVTEPDLRTPAQARAYIQELQRIVRSFGVSKADMEKGHLRVDGNVSVRPVGQKEFGDKVEVKNVNSARFLEKALAFEIERQIKVLENGEKVVQETRGWDEKTGTTVSQRIKEGSVDYRYFPEPDLPPIEISEEFIATLSKAAREMNPRELRQAAVDAGLAYDRAIELQDQDKLMEFVQHVRELGQSVDVLKLANLLTRGRSFANDKRVREFFEVVSEKSLSNTMTEKLHDLLQENPNVSVKELAERLPITDAVDLDGLVKKVLDANPEVVARYKAGETKLLGFFVGQVMAEGKGAVEPAEVQGVLKELLS